MKKNVHRDCVLPFALADKQNIETKHSSITSARLLLKPLYRLYIFDFMILNSWLVNGLKKIVDLFGQQEFLHIGFQS